MNRIVRNGVVHDVKSRFAVVVETSDEGVIGRNGRKFFERPSEKIPFGDAHALLSPIELRHDSFYDDAFALRAHQYFVHRRDHLVCQLHAAVHFRLISLCVEHGADEIPLRIDAAEILNPLRAVSEAGIDVPQKIRLRREPLTVRERTGLHIHPERNVRF